MQIYTGSRATVKIFDNNDTNYRTAFNDDTLKVLADISFVDAPINGATEILDGSITNAKIADGTIQSSKLAAAASVGVLTNNTYIKGRNNADNADLNMIKINTNNLLEAGSYWTELRLSNNKKLGARTAGGADADWMQENASDQWEYLATAYTQTLLPKTTNTYDLGGSSNVINKVYTKNLRVSDSSTSADFYQSGTWTPTIVGETTAGTATYTTQTGTYVIIGKRFFAQCIIVWTGHTGTGNMQIQGWGQSTVTGAGGYNEGTVALTNIAYTAGAALTLQTIPNNAAHRIVMSINGGGGTYVQISAAGQIVANISYNIA